MFNFPLYALRAHQSIFKEGEYKCIATQKTRYTLDYSEREGEYSARRIKLLQDKNRPYNLYPLKYRYETVGQIITSKHRTFIDSTGKIVKWVPKKFFPVTCHRIKSSWTTPAGYTGIEVAGTKFTISNYQGERFAQLVTVGKRNFLFDIHLERVPATRKKL